MTSRFDLSNRQAELRAEAHQAYTEYLDSGRTDDEAFAVYQYLTSELIEVASEMSRLAEKRYTDLIEQQEKDRIEREHQARLYERPSKGFAGWISRRLAPISGESKKINVSDKALAALPDYRLLAGAVVIVAIAMILTATTFVPWLAVSPFSLLLNYFVPLFGATGGWTITVALSVLFLGAGAKGISIPDYNNGGMLTEGAAAEEQWFRMGAESWNMKQRATSCVAFGCLHVINVIYPIVSLLVLSLVGAVFMAVYLRVYRRSNDTELAVQAATKLHATYNRFAIVYLVVAVGCSLIASRIL